MGRLLYGERVRADFDDRTLAHLQLVIGAKVRRGESFHFSWRDDKSLGEGRTVIWIHPAALMTYKFDEAGAPRINRAWIEQLVATANSSAGLRVTPEPPEPTSPQATSSPVRR